MQDLKMNKLAVTAGVAALVAFGTPLAAEAASVNFESYNYTGTAITYNTLPDAQNGTGSTGSHNIQTRTNGTNSTLPDARDAYIYADTSTNDFRFATAWYFNPQSNLSLNSGEGNPNNSNNGFIQLYDVDGSTLSNLSMGWDPTFTQFSINASGTNAGASDEARFWPAPNPGGPISTSSGTFVEYDYELVATFSSASPSGINTGVLPDNVTGSFSAIFENTGLNPGSSTFYVISLLFHNGSAAEYDNYAFSSLGDLSFSETIAYTSFVSPVPLPAALPLFAGGLGLLGLLGLRRKRRPAAA